MPDDQQPSPIPLTVEDVSIPTDDGRELSGQLFVPTGSDGTPDAVVAMHPATGVDYNLYLKFGQYLAGRGWPTLIYDLRGSGFSERPGDRSDASMRMSDWILRDVPSATNWLRARYPRSRLLAVGHSVGAHGQAAVGSREAPVDALAMIASHAGVTRLIRGRAERAKVWTIFNVAIPALTRVLGYVPVARLGMGRSIPVGVLTQWARWSRTPGYFFDDADFDLAERFSELSIPVLSMVFSDDPWANRTAANVLTDTMVRADVTKRDVQVGPGGEIAGPVDHMGFFRSQNRQLWPLVADWLAEQLRNLDAEGRGGNHGG